jgi:undecaprenyl-diphosphatase
MSFLQAILLAIIEGLTEFLPVSSTGHMILGSSLMGIAQDPFTKLFEICIQFGAILAVVVLYWKKFFNFKNLRFYLKLLLAVIPALVLGKLFDDWIDANLGNPVFIALILLLGGIILLFIDRIFNKGTIDDEKKLSIPKAIAIGCYQCLAIVFPGLSRSAATIIGGMQQGLTRKAAAEFSFFLAVPTMAAATIYKTYDFVKDNGNFTSSQISLLAVGNVVAFMVGIIAIKFFVAILTKYGFKFFGIYRIIVGALILILAACGFQFTMV